MPHIKTVNIVEVEIPYFTDPFLHAQRPLTKSPTTQEPVGPLQLEVTWNKIQNIGEQKNVPDSKTKHN